MKAGPLLSGRNGLDERCTCLRKAETALARLAAPVSALDEGGNTIVLRRGSFGDAAAEQHALMRAKGFDLSADSAFGPATEPAVMLFQKYGGLAVDGVVGSNTWQA